jgi:hypothetical protein
VQTESSALKHYISGRAPEAQNRVELSAADWLFWYFGAPKGLCSTMAQSAGVAALIAVDIH